MDALAEGGIPDEGDGRVTLGRGGRRSPLGVFGTLEDADTRRELSPNALGTAKDRGAGLGLGGVSSSSSDKVPSEGGEASMGEGNLRGACTSTRVRASVGETNDVTSSGTSGFVV